MRGPCCSASGPTAVPAFLPREPFSLVPALNLQDRLCPGDTQNELGPFLKEIFLPFISFLFFSSFIGVCLRHKGCMSLLCAVWCFDIPWEMRITAKLISIFIGCIVIDWFCGENTFDGNWASLITLSLSGCAFECSLAPYMGRVALCVYLMRTTFYQGKRTLVDRFSLPGDPMCPSQRREESETTFLKAPHTQSPVLPELIFWWWFSAFENSGEKHGLRSEAAGVEKSASSLVMGSVT